MSVLGERLRQARASKGFTQDYVARIIRTKYQTISNYERGTRDPDTETLTRIADLYEVSVGWLVGQTNDPTPPQAPTAPATPEEQVLSAREIGEAIRISFNLYSEGKIDELTCYRLTKLAEEKFGLPSIKTDEAAYPKEKIPGSGILGDDKNEKSNSGNTEKHGSDIRYKDSTRKSSPKPTR